jgi:hypothetical protein
VVWTGWIGLDEDKDKWRDLVKEVMNFWVPQNVVKFLNKCTNDSFSKRVQLQSILCSQLLTL